jgi:F0F1-type ATP synthase membrane subunit b/b'
MFTKSNITTELLTALLSALIIILPILARMVQQCLELRIAELKVKLDSNTAITKRNEAALNTALTELAATRAQVAEATAASAKYRAAHPKPSPTEPLNP